MIIDEYEQSIPSDYDKTDVYIPLFLHDYLLNVMSIFLVIITNKSTIYIWFVARLIK